MPELQHYIYEVEAATGLPGWCLLLLSALVLVIVVLAAYLARANRRMRAAQGGVVVPKAPVAAGEGAKEGRSAAEAPVEGGSVDEASEGEGGTFVEAGPALGEGSGEGGAPAAKEEPGDVTAETASTAQSDGAFSAAPGPMAESEPAPQTGREPEPAPAAAPEPGSGSDAEPAPEPGREPAAGPDAEAADAPDLTRDEPVVEVVEGAFASDPAVQDEEIVKATAGSHSRIGQSAFGIDFGFLEEYEAEYDRALEEFRRLRSKVDE